MPTLWDPPPQALGPRALLVLSTVILPCDLQPGHDLCQQGQSADRIWLLSEGLAVVPITALSPSSSDPFPISNLLYPLSPLAEVHISAWHWPA